MQDSTICPILVGLATTVDVPKLWGVCAYSSGASKTVDTHEH